MEKYKNVYIKRNDFVQRFEISTQNLNDRIIDARKVQRLKYKDFTLQDVKDLIDKYYK